MRSQAPKLDLKVRILFEENLYTMVFPKVKELLFRVSKTSPIELAAKVLARKNEHATKWRDYSFSLLKAKDSQSEITFTDLSVTFSSLLANQQEDSLQDANLSMHDDLLLFYKVKDLQPYDFKVASQAHVVTSEETSTIAHEDSKEEANVVSID